VSTTFSAKVYDAWNLNGACGDWSGASEWADDEDEQEDLKVNIEFGHDDVDIKGILGINEADGEKRNEGEEQKMKKWDDIRFQR
jgi:hypothetical protein